MALIISFVAGLFVTALAAFLISRNIIRSRVVSAEETAQMRVEAFYKAEQARIESDLRHARQRADELQAGLEAAKLETQRQVLEVRNESAVLLNQAKTELSRRHSEDIAMREDTHKQAMAALQSRFEETIAKVTAQVKADTADMLKARQKEFSETSNVTIGQIVDPLKQNIAELKKAMDDAHSFDRLNIIC